MADTLNDDYVRRTAIWIRTNEAGLAGVRSPRPNAINPFTWVSTPQKPTILTLTKAQLSYLLTRIEGVGVNVGCLDIPIENPRPSQLLPKDVSDTQSISSFVSNLSLSPSSWFTKPTPIDVELKYIYSSFTKLPSLHLTNPPSHQPDKYALPLDAFKNLQALRLDDIDPRSLLGWDRLAEGLRSLTVRRSGIEDVTHLIVDAVLDDEARRKNGDLAPIRRKAPSRRSSQRRSRHPSWQGSQRHTHAIQEEDAEEAPQVLSSSSSDSNPALPKLSPSKWWALRHLSLADNSLTFFPADVFPYLTSLSHLDLSNNLLIAVPPGLDELHRLSSLDLSGNMIESVLGIYQMLGQVLTLNLGHNRLESLCGLERLVGLQRIDLRNNRIEESAEVGRLATLPHVAEVWVSGNPLTTLEEDWRVKCFSHFSKEGKEIMLDGSAPGYLERGRIDSAVGTPQMNPLGSPRAQIRSTPHSRSNSVATKVGSPALNGLGSPPNGAAQSQASNTSSPVIAPTPSYVATIHAHPKSKKRKQPRIVDLDHGDDTSSRDHSPDSHAHHHPSRAFRAVPSSSPSKPSVLTSPPIPSADPSAEVNLSSPTVAEPPNGLPAFTTTPTPTKEKKAYMSATLGRHSRRATTMSSEAGEDDAVAALPIAIGSSPGLNGRGRRSPSGSATLSASTGPMSKGSKRRARVSASVYEPSASTLSGSPPSAGSSPRKPSSMKPSNGDTTELQFASEADAFRAKIEALRNEVGDSWLKVLSQSNNLATTPGVGR